MRLPEAVIAALAASSLAAGVLVALHYTPTWPLVMAAAGAGFGALSIILYSRRLMFIGAASPHAGFLAAAASIPLASTIGGPEWPWALLVGLLVVYIAGYMAYRGVDPDEATSLMVSFSASLGALAVYLVLSHYMVGGALAAIVVGDPLLASTGEALAAATVAAGLATISLLIAREVYYAGIDYDDARLSGLRMWAYDLLLYTMIAVAAVAMVRIVGFVLEHALILLPGAVAYYASRGVYRSVVISTLAGLAAGLWGLVLGVAFNLAPSPLSGLILVALYLAARAWGGRSG